MVGHFLFDDQLVLGVDRDLNVVADGDTRVRRHGPAVGIGQRYLVFARVVELVQHGVVPAALLAQGLDLLGEIFHPRAVCSRLGDVALVEPREVIRQPLVDRLDECSRELRVKLRALLLTALMRVPSTAKSSRPNRSSRLHSSVNWRNTDLNAARLSARKSATVLKSGFSVRSSQMTSMLRWHSASSRRLDRTRLRYP